MSAKIEKKTTPDLIRDEELALKNIFPLLQVHFPARSGLILTTRHFITRKEEELLVNRFMI